MITPEQVISFAPDDSSAKAGQKLAVVSKWPTLAHDSEGKAVWGACQGSGKTPYRTMVDLHRIAFKCSCPSRKFPCKHSLALLLLYSSGRNHFTVSAFPEDVSAWLEKRNETREKKAKKEAEPTDPAARDKRIRSREQRIANGIDELQRWLRDYMRQGIMNIPQDAYHFHENMMARLVDAQAPGLANQLRLLSEVPFHQENWPFLFLKRASQLYALSCAYRKKEDFSESEQADLNQAIGWNIPREQVLSQPIVKDQWVVVSIRETAFDRLTAEYIWLWGETSNRFVLILRFFPPGQFPEEIFAVGTSIDADVCYYPGAVSQRGMIATQRKVTPVRRFPSGFQTIVGLLEYTSGLVVKQPFLENHPVILVNATLQRSHSGIWHVCDSESCGIPISSAEQVVWKCLSITGGEPAAIFGTISDNRLDICSVIFNDKIYQL